MNILRTWNIRGTDDKYHTVNEIERPGIRSAGLSSPVRVIRTGLVEYMLADGGQLFDEKPGYWETNSGVQIKKPDDLDE